MIDNEWDGTEAEAMQDMAADSMMDEEDRLERENEAIKRRAKLQAIYATNGKALVGEAIDCPCCGKRVRKAHYQQRFCGSLKCKDRYHNTVSESRRMRSAMFNPRAKF